MVNFAKLLQPGMRAIVEKIPQIREELRLKYLADPTAYRRDKYSCKCQVDGHGVFLVSPLCFVHSDPIDLDPQYKYTDPPASWIEEQYGPDTMVNCINEAQK